MKYSYILLLITLMLMFIVNDLRSQKTPYLKNHDEIVQTAMKELDTSVREGTLYKLGKAEGIRGNYTYDITVGKRGRVVTVFAVSRDGSVQGQNQLKDQLKVFRFHFKIPKSNTYKFQYTVSLK